MLPRQKLSLHSAEGLREGFMDLGFRGLGFRGWDEDLEFRILEQVWTQSGFRR